MENESILYKEFTAFCQEKNMRESVIDTLIKYSQFNDVIDEFSSRPGNMEKAVYYSLIDEFCEKFGYIKKETHSQAHTNSFKAWKFQKTGLTIKWEFNL